MPTFQANPERITYLIPFSYGDHSEILVKHVNGDGEESALVYGTDYRIIEHCVVLTPDANGKGLSGMLLIESKSPALAARILEAERIEAARKAGLWEAKSAWFAERAARIALDSAEAAAAQCETAQTAIDNMGANARESISNAVNALAAQVNASQQAYMTEALTKIYRACYEAVARANNPGIAAVRGMDDLTAYSAGCFIINPNLLQPTPFMGFYPVQSLNPVTWDGIFVIIPDCPGHDKLSNLVPPDFTGLPGQPAIPGSAGNSTGLDDPANNGEGVHWLPCGHEHAQGR